MNGPNIINCMVLLATCWGGIASSGIAQGYDTPLEVLNRTEVERAATYPKSLNRAGIGGRVVVEVFVDSTGQYTGHRVETSTHDSFRLALEAVLPLMRTSMPRRKGQAVSGSLRIPYFFTPDPAKRDTSATSPTHTPCDPTPERGTGRGPAPKDPVSSWWQHSDRPGHPGFD